MKNQRRIKNYMEGNDMGEFQGKTYPVDGEEIKVEEIEG